MKNIICVAMLCLACNLAHAQNDPKSKEIINEIIKEKSIIYQDSIGKFAIKIMHEGLWYPQSHMFYKESADSVIYTNASGKQVPMSRTEATPLVLKEKGGRMRPVRLDSMVISVEEMKYVNAEIDKMSTHKWDKGLLENSQMITTDTVNAIFKDRKRSWSYMYKIGINKFYTFAKPISLHNGRFCLFYHAYSCGGLCGYGEFALYKKENGQWVRWTSISAWIS